nr:inner capsid protein sigma A [Avian orthoreovirus]
MARAVYDFFSTPFGNRGLATNRTQLSSLLTSSNSPWQRFLSSMTPLTAPGIVSTPEAPYPGSLMYQESMLHSATVPGILGNRDAWRTFNVFGLSWTDEGLSGLVAAQDPPPAAPYQPASAQWSDLLNYPRWANRRRELQSKYPLLLRSTLLSAMRAGPVLYVETWPNMISGRLADWFMSQYGNNFVDMCARLTQSCSNMPVESDGNYDQQMRALISLWLLSYIGVVNQTNTISGFYFSSKTRGQALDSWTLFYTTNTNRVQITQRHFAYVCARSPDWNVDKSWIAAANLTAIVMACRQPPMFANQGVINQAQNRPGFSVNGGTPVHELNLLTTAQECIRQWVVAGLVSAAKGQTLTQEANDFSALIQADLGQIKAQDDALYNQQPGYARRVKPFVNGDWTPGMTAQALAVLATFTA